MSRAYYFYKGRVALYSLLKTFGISEGDRVLIPGYTCIVVPLAIRYLGAIPEYADIDSQSYNALLENYQATYDRLVQQGIQHKLKAVVVQHTYGNPNRDIVKIVTWAREKGLFILEDCAHINGVTINGEPVGNFGDGAFFSTQWSKPFTTGLGGIAQLNRDDYNDKLIKIYQSAQSPGIKESVILGLQVIAHKMLLQPNLYWFAINTHRKLSKLGLFVGSSTINELNGEMPEDYIKKMGNLQQWLLVHRAAKMDKINLYRKILVNEYDRLLIERSLPNFKYEENALLIRYPIHVKDKATCLKAAKENKIEIGDWFDHPLHPAGSNLKNLNWDDDLCKSSCIAARDVVNLPVHERISKEELSRIVDFIVPYIIN